MKDAAVKDPVTITMIETTGATTISNRRIKAETTEAPKIIITTETTILTLSTVEIVIEVTASTIINTIETIEEETEKTVTTEIAGPLCKRV